MAQRFITLICIAVAAISGAAQHTTASLVDAQRDSVKQSHRIIGIGGATPSAANDSVRHLIEMFYYDQFRHFSDPEAPYFLFMSRDASLAMGIGGAVRMRGYYDWHGAMPGAGFAPYLISMHPDPTEMRHFATTPAGTSLFFRVIGRNKALGHYSLYIEANFNGYQSRDFHLKKAYATVNDFTIGYAPSTFSDPAAVPATVDAQGPANKISPTNLLVRWMPRLSKNWVMAVSLETPAQANAATDSLTKRVMTWLPDVATFAQYEWGPTSHVRLAGVVRAMSYRDMASGRNHTEAGWGLQLSSVAHPVPRLTTYASVSYGHGYAGLGGDLAIGNYDLVAEPDSPGRLYAPASAGWCVGAQWNFRPNLFTSASVSGTHYLPRKPVEGDEYAHGIVADVNVFWNLTARIQFGAELDWAMRTNQDGSSNHAWRAGLLCQFSF